MVTNCTCKPGSNENGWHEDRCQICLDEELEIWRYLVQDEGLHRRLRTEILGLPE